MSTDEQSFSSVWTRPRRQEQPSLSRELIVSAAIRVLDSEGIGALSMRRLGTELNAPPTSINWHVAKDELVELVVHHVLGEVEVPDARNPAGWRAAATRCARSLRSMILRHPWIGAMLGEVVIGLGPNMMRLSEGLLATFETAGLSPEEGDHALNAVVAYVIGTATTEAAGLTKLARSGQDERDLANAAWPSLEKAAQQFPRLRQRYHDRRNEDPRVTREKVFNQGLQLILDGLEIRSNRRR